MNKLFISIITCLIFMFGGNIYASNFPPQELGHRVFLSNLLDCARAYKLEGDSVLHKGVLDGYGHKGELSREPSSPVPKWTHILLLSPGDYTLTIWCPKHGGEHKASTLKIYNFSLTKEQLDSPKGKGPLTIYLEKDIGEK